MQNMTQSMTQVERSIKTGSNVFTDDFIGNSDISVPSLFKLQRNLHIFFTSDISPQGRKMEECLQSDNTVEERSNLDLSPQQNRSKSANNCKTLKAI